jgi:SAM-dependent methyltransferase
MNSRRNFEDYLGGKFLIGDDYSYHEILRWYEEEKNAYADLIDAKDSYSYEYHALNERCGFRILNEKPSRSLRVCGFGSAYGDELAPIQEKISNTVLIDSADAFHKHTAPTASLIVPANPTGKINISENSLDLVTCFGVLHHIPNVSFVFSEFYRCLASGGILLVREPTTSMGDWRTPRVGVTKNERGIPADIFRNIILSAGFEIIRETPCFFPPFSAVCRKLGIRPYANKYTVGLDLLLSTLFSWNYKYHRTGIIDRFAPASLFYVCIKNN